MNECEVIRDLLPLYMDGVCSEKSRELVERHLDNCDECQKELEKMKLDFKADSAATINSVKAAKKVLNRIGKKNWAKGAVTVIICVSVLICAFLGYHAGVSFPEDDTAKLTAAAEAYFDTDGLTALKAVRKGSYLAVLFKGENANGYIGVFERDSVFDSRYEISGGTIDFDSGKIANWNLRNEKGEAVLVFGGIGIPDSVKGYEFQNSGIRYSCPVDGENVLDLFVISDTNDINAAPVMF